jgi:type IVB pilus formation R64 PilN family outer membrane protein
MPADMKKNLFLLAALSIAVSVASGCAVYKDKRATDDYHEAMSRSTGDHLGHIADSVTLDAKRAAQDVDRPYITGKAIPLSREVTLPSPLRGKIDTTLVYKDDSDLMKIAEYIKTFTGIPVKVMPDALLPLDMFMPRLGKQDGAGGSAQAFVPRPAVPIALNSPLPVGGAEPQGLIASQSSGYLVPVQKQPLSVAAGGQQDLATALDSIALRNGVFWKYDDQIGAIVFYRTETRRFEIRGAEYASTSNMSVEQSGNLDNKNSSGLASKSNTQLGDDKKQDDPMDGVVHRITQFMSRAGAIAAGSGGMIVVTDTKTALDQIASYVAEENLMRTRQVDFVFEEITIEKSTSSQSSMNWNLAFNGGTGNNVQTGGLNSLLEQEGAAASLGVSVGSGPWKGSSIAVQALSKVGKIVDQKMNTFGSLNGQPATSGRPQRQKYIDKLEQTQSFNDNSSPTVSVTQAEEVSGRIITVTPHAYSNGDINLSIKYDNTPTPVFDKQTLPDGSYVQSPSSVGDVLLRTAMLHSGQPFVITAQSLNSTQYDERRTDRNASILFGGSDVAAKSDRVTVFVLTAMVRDK